MKNTADDSMTSETIEKYRKEKTEQKLKDWEKTVGIPLVFREVGKIDWENKIFVGPAGCGKSYKAAQMVYSLRNKRELPKWVNIPKMLFDLRREFDNQIVDRILYKDYVVLDDLGSEHTTDWVTETVYIIVNHFWENEKNLIVTSNLGVEDIAERFGDRLASRLLDICEVEKMEERDYRLKEN